LKCRIHVWNQSNGKIIVKVGNEFEINPLNFFYGNNHFAPTKLFYETYNVNNENERIIGLREIEILINKTKI
jgi:hypothetical protein